MTEVKTLPFGSWTTPITADLIVAGSIRLGGVTLDGEDIYWLEGRASEGGRNVLVKGSVDGSLTDVTPAPFNVRSRVHEYGGGAFLVVDSTVYFVNYTDQRIYRQLPGEQPQALTPACERRYSDLILDKSRDRLICVCEEHIYPERGVRNYLVTIDLASGNLQEFLSGSDFYSSPRLHPDGTKLAWLTWNHPHMPWDSTQLWLADLNEDGSVVKAEVVAGGETESICEPKWSPDGKLYFSSDRTGWWNLYRFDSQGNIESLQEMEAEFAYPHWVFGLSNYTFASPEKIICSYSQNGRWYLATLDLPTKKLHTWDLPYTDIESLHANSSQVVCLASSPTESNAVVKLDIHTGEREVLRKSSELKVEPGYLSVAESVSFPTADGAKAYGWFYPPKNQDYEAPEGELPPLLVKSHGGPTAAASPSLSLKIQYWTSRGFAVLDVNYGGSSGYGRAYRARLDKNWGIVDVQDCVQGAEYLVKAGKVDGERLAISGGSAGGYTTLAALTFYDTFKAGASYYGISDLEALAKDTHKFESRYLDGLIGAYPEEQEIYQQRSPIHFTEKLSCPVIFFQGLEDKVVPPNQAEMMVNALKNKGLPVAYVTFPNEQHGFRRSENIKRSLDGEFYFYGRIFGFEPAEAIEAVEIMGDLGSNR